MVAHNKGAKSKNSTHKLIRQAGLRATVVWCLDVLYAAEATELYASAPRRAFAYLGPAMLPTYDVPTLCTC